MKKYFLLIVLCLVLSYTQAQDTICRPINYLYQLESDTISYSHNCSLGTSPYFEGKEFVLNSDVLLYGIATTAGPGTLEGRPHAVWYALLLTKDSVGGYVRVDSVRREMIGAYPTPEHWYVYPTYDCLGTTTTQPLFFVYPVYEFYFRTPHILTDTVYLGLKGFHTGHGDNYNPDLNLPDQLILLYTTWDNSVCNPDKCIWLWQMGPDNYLRQEYQQNGIFGILTPPDTDMVPECPLVKGLQVQRYYNHMPVFAWDDTATGNYQIAYGPAGIDPDSCRRASCHEWPFLLQDNTLDSTVLYHAYIRQECHHECVVHDTSYWGDWSLSVPFYTGTHDPSDTSSQGVVSPHQLAFTLSPNPAHDQVMVTLSSDQPTPCQVTLRDETGRELATFAVKEHTFGLNIAAFPAGVYYVTLKSGKRMGAQKLVKQ